MSSKKKMIIAISAFALVVVATVVSVVAVLAAQNLTLKSNITISYTTREIQGTMTAAYKVKGGTEVSIGSVSPDGTDDDGAELDMGTKTIDSLTKTNDYVDFIFTFTNSGPTAYTAKVTAPTSSDFTITYSATANGEPTANAAATITIAANTATAVTYKVRYQLKAYDKNVTLTGDFTWILTSV